MNNINELLDATGMTAPALEQVIGKSRYTIYAWRQGKFRPRTEDIIAIKEVIKKRKQMLGGLLDE